MTAPFHDQIAKAPGVAERLVASWRANFDRDDDRPLVNMIAAALAGAEVRVQAAAKRAAAEAVHAAADWIWDEEPLLADASVELHRQADALLAALTPGADTAGATA